MTKPQSARNRSLTAHCPHIRCAVYTRKSTDEGLGQEFNSLDAQYEACASYIASQAGMGWKIVADRYDDGGVSGGTMDRHGLQRLMQDIQDGKIDVIVVYKIDRLTRSLADFAKIVDILDQKGASFVSVTQQFNTTTSMGRLTLNVLLSFAQFEREVTAERIRDKIAASKKRGMWMGGRVPLGYRVMERKLVVKESEARFVRWLFTHYLELGSVTKLVAEINNLDCRTGCSVELPARYAGKPVRSGMIYKLLANPVYIGKVRHKQNIYDGEHEAIITQDQFASVQARLASNAVATANKHLQSGAHLLTGLLYDETGIRLSPTHGKAHGRRYRYYVSSHIKRANQPDTQAWRIAAGDIEKIVLDVARQILTDEHRISDWARESHLATQIQDIMTAAKNMAKSIDGHVPTRTTRSLITALFKMITLHNTCIQFEIMPEAIITMLTSQQSHDEPAHGLAHYNETIALPITLKRRGVGTKILIDSPYAKPEPDKSLVDIVARAHIFLDMMTGQDNMGSSAIASHCGMNRADVGRIMPLAFLGPRCLKAILEGRQSSSLIARQLAREELPLFWHEQEAALL